MLWGNWIFLYKNIKKSLQVGIFCIEEIISSVGFRNYLSRMVSSRVLMAGYLFFWVYQPLLLLVFFSRVFFYYFLVYFLLLVLLLQRVCVPFFSVLLFFVSLFLPFFYDEHPAGLVFVMVFLFWECHQLKQWNQLILMEVQNLSYVKWLCRNL